MLLFKRNPRVIDFVLMECSACGSVHSVEKKSARHTTTVNGQKVSYDRLSYYCAECNKQFETPHIMRVNQKAIREAAGAAELLISI